VGFPVGPVYENFTGVENIIGRMNASPENPKELGVKYSDLGG
jgi:hypothetical protein